MNPATEHTRPRINESASIALMETLDQQETLQVKSSTKGSQLKAKSTIRELGCMYTNADQLRNKLTELETRVTVLTPMIIGITEVKPKNSVGKSKTQEYTFESLSNYKMFSKNVSNNTGRGLLMYVDRKLACSEVKIDSRFEEMLAVRVNLNKNDKLLVVLVYRSNAGSTGNNEELNRMFKAIYKIRHSHLIIMGDFNYPLINWNDLTAPGNDNTREALFLDAVLEAYLTQHVISPTRCRGEMEASLLDLIFTNEENMIRELTHQAPLGKSDHSVLTFTFTCFTELQDRWITRYQYTKGNYEGFEASLRNVDWDTMFESGNVNTIWNEFEEVIQQHMDRYIPKRSFNANNHRKRAFPLPPGIREKIKEKSRLANKIFKKGVINADSRNAYNKCRNKVQKLVKKARKEFEKSIAARAKDNPKTIWKYIKAKSRTRAEIEELHTSPTDQASAITKKDPVMAQILSDYFKSVYVTEDLGNIPATRRRNTMHDDQPIRTNEAEVSDLLHELKTDKSPGPDGLQPYMLKRMALSLAGPLARLFNLSFSTADIPEKWKLATVCAIHKKGDTRLAANYRPVSLTSIICKVCEKIVRKNLMIHLEINNLTTPKQFGFLPRRNISLQLLCILEEWTEAWDKGEEVDCVYLDFSKAFDRVPHARLIAKLNTFAFDGGTIAWIREFLTGREQQVSVGAAVSERVKVTSGIPQGSVLGPILFILYVNDLPDCVRNNLVLFADDTKIYSRNDLPSLQEDLDKLITWSANWQLTFNEGKCKHLHIGRREPEQSLQLGNHTLDRVQEEKDLGVTFETSLKFKKHIQEKILKANSMFGIIRRTFHHLDKDTFLPLYKGMVRSHLDFCASVYAPINLQEVNRIEAVQRRATKQLPEMKGLDYPERLRKLKLPTLAYRRHRSDMIELYKATSGKYEKELCRFYKLRVAETERPGRRFHDKTLYQTPSRTNIRSHAFGNRNVKLWNSLPIETVNAPSTDAFKKRLDKHWQNQPIVYDYRQEISPRMPPTVEPL